MVVPYCYQCAPAAQPAILSIANAYSSQPLTEERRADWYAAAAKVEQSARLRCPLSSRRPEVQDRFNALRTARTEASSMLVSTPAPHRVRPLLGLIWM